MTDLEDRLRTELATFAQRADPALIRPLREPAVRARPRVPGWLAPAAAAAAVAAVVLGVAFADRLAGHGPAIGPVAGVPRYYLTLDRPWSGHVARAVVHGSGTGAAVATGRIPLLGGESPSVTGAADAGRSSSWTTPLKRPGTGMASGSIGSASDPMGVPCGWTPCASRYGLRPWTMWPCRPMAAGWRSRNSPNTARSRSARWPPVPPRPGEPGHLAPRGIFPGQRAAIRSGSCGNRGCIPRRRRSEAGTGC